MPDLKKQEILNNLIQNFKIMKGFIIAEHSGLTVSEMDNLRRQLHQEDNKCIVAKNSLLELAMQKLKIDIDRKILTGPTTVIINNNDDIIPITKSVVNFVTAHKNFKIKIAFLDRKYIDYSQIQQISQIDSKKALIENVLNSLNTPIKHFISTIFILLYKLIIIFSAILQLKKTISLKKEPIN
ncbi:MAG: 50S ribosomal protein L10 [Lachnospiraceae bacterium]|jgi:large subunit ribosomal protein L10|nr:50S ribosomal protein L10 [Lachnospiraceae bacterium]